MLQPNPSHPKPSRRSLVDEFGGFIIAPSGDAVRLPRNPFKGIYYHIKAHLEVLF